MIWVNWAFSSFKPGNFGAAYFPTNPTEKTEKTTAGEGGRTLQAGAIDSDRHAVQSIWLLILYNILMIFDVPCYITFVCVLYLLCHVVLCCIT